MGKNNAKIAGNIIGATRIKMDLKKEQLKNKIEFELKDLIKDVYNKPRNTHYWLPVKYSVTIVKIMEEHLNECQ